ncbi:MAG: transglycosylase SLT domain-containing protein [Elusimicrobiota bacterium]
MRISKLAVLALSAALAAFGARPAAADERPPDRPASYHIYLHVPPLPDASKEDQQARRQAVEVRLTAIVDGGALGDRIEQTLDGQWIVRWSAKTWTPRDAGARIARAKAAFAPAEKVSIALVPVEHQTVEVRDPAEIEQRLRTDTGAVHEWYRERFGPSFPRELLVSADGGAVFDFSAVRQDAPGLDSAGVLFDATGRPRDAAAVTERIRLARAKPGAQSGVNSRIKEPPAPPKFDGAVIAAAEDAETQDALRALIYASRGYENGFGKGSGLHGPMGLSNATFQWAQKEAGAEQKKILEQGIDDDRANILAGAIVFDRLKTQFGGNTSRAVAAFHVGAGNVRKHGGIPADAQHYLARFHLAHQQGIRRALDPASPKAARKKVVAEKPVSPIGAILRRIREEATALLRGEPPTGRRDSFKNVPKSLVEDIWEEATSGKWQTDPNALIALSEAEGGVNAGTSHANARGVLQITPETALWECGLSRAELADRAKNIACAEKVFARRLKNADGDIVLAWALYNTKVKWHRQMIAEKRVANIKETVRHVTRAAYRYYQLTGNPAFDPGSRAFREKYFKTVQALRWSAESYLDIQRWDRNEGYKGEIRYAEKVPALEGTLAAGPNSAPGRWRRNSTGTHWYRSSRAQGQRWDVYPYRDQNGRVTDPPV